MNLRRLKGHITDIDTDWTYIQVDNAPARFIVHRVRFAKLTGSADGLAIRIMEDPDGDALDVPLEISLRPPPANCYLAEPTLVESAHRSADLNSRASIWVGMKADSGDDTSAGFRLDIQPLTDTGSNF